MRTTSILVALGFLIGCAGGSAQEPNPHVHSAENASTNTSDLDDLPSIGHSSELLRQAEEAVTAQNWKGAATLFSRVWEPGFPVDAFVTNLESSRSNAMEQAARHPELRDAIYMQAFKSSVRTLAACPEPFPPDLPGEYMVHGLLATDSRQNPRAELTAADPWRIAIQLHAVRYGDSDLSPQRTAEIAVDRYGERPDLWTEAVTHQLWLLAAEADLVEESSAWPEELRPSWRHPVSGRGLLAIEVRQWGGGMLQPMPGTIGLLIDGQPANPGWTGRPEPREFESGTHEFRFLNGQLHSSSVKIEIEPGTTKTVLLIAIAGV